MNFKIALAGNPNCGKTTLFNDLTGSKQHVGNWPGVTVEKKAGKYKKNKDLEIIDLPGIYSMSPYTAEEIVARDYIINERPDVLINIIDGTNIERNLYLTLQILETGIPTIIALNMMDEVEAQGTKIDVNQLSKKLGVTIVPIVARNEKGVKELMEETERLAKTGKPSKNNRIFSSEIIKYIDEVKALINDDNEDVREWKSIKLLEEDEIVYDSLEEGTKKAIDKVITKANEDFEGDCEAKMADERYKYITKIIEKTVVKGKSKTGGRKETTSDKIDKVLTNRIFAIPIFAFVMYLLFLITFGEGFIGIGVKIQDLVVNFWDGPFTEIIMKFLEGAGAASWVLSLIGDGILAGVGGVVSFMPQILILFLLMSFLEDSGYMARVAFVMDRIFRRFGLSGKSFIPLLMGFGCSVPALMAARTLENEKDRKITMMITPFMSCGAKLPIYLMFAATLFPNNNKTLIIYSIYMIGLAVAIISAIVLNKFIGKGETSNFIMELPQYRVPTLKSIFIHAFEKVKGFAVRAGTIILASTILIWFLSSFNFSGPVEMEESILAQIGNGIAWIFKPLGFGNWKATVGVVTGWIAKENIVSTFGVLFGASDNVIEAAMEGNSGLPGIIDVFTKASAFSYMTFNLLCMPCFAAVGAMRREMGSWKWTGITVAFQMSVAWVVSLLVFNICKVIF